MTDMTVAGLDDLFDQTFFRLLPPDMQNLSDNVPFSYLLLINPQALQTVYIWGKVRDGAVGEMQRRRSARLRRTAAEWAPLGYVQTNTESLRFIRPAAVKQPLVRYAITEAPLNTRFNAEQYSKLVAIASRTGDKDLIDTLFYLTLGLQILCAYPTYKEANPDPLTRWSNTDIEFVAALFKVLETL